MTVSMHAQISGIGAGLNGIGVWKLNYLNIDFCFKVLSIRAYPDRSLIYITNLHHLF